MIFRDIILDILEITWPVLFICSVIASIMRTYDLIVNKKKFVFYKDALFLMFIIYCICLFEVVTFQDVTWSTSNVTLFKEIFRYELGSNMFLRNVIGNIVLFIPLGFFLSYFLRMKKFIVLFLMVLLISLSIETTQLIIGRVFDIDDLLLNLIGGIIGYYIYRMFDKINIFKNKKVCNIAIIILILIFGLYLGGIYV